MVKNIIAILICSAYVIFSIWRIKSRNITKKGWVFFIMFALCLVFTAVMTILGVPLDKAETFIKNLIN